MFVKRWGLLQLVSYKSKNNRVIAQFHLKFQAFFSSEFDTFLGIGHKMADAFLYLCGENF